MKINDRFSQLNDGDTCHDCVGRLGGLNGCTLKWFLVKTGEWDVTINNCPQKKSITEDANKIRR